MKNLEDLDLNLLLLLHWLLEERSVTRAAMRVGLSQPAASRALQRLRLDFGDELLIRSGRNLIPSQMAMGLQDDLAAAVSKLRLITQQSPQFKPAESKQTIVIACNDYLSKVAIDIWRYKIAPYAPNIKSSWRPLDQNALESLAKGQIDLLLGPNEIIASAPQTSLFQDLIIRPLLNDRYVIFGPKDHPAMTRKSLTTKAFASFEQVLVSPTGKGLSFVDKALAKLELQRTIKHRASNFSNAIDLALSLKLLTVLPERFVQGHTGGTHRALPVEQPEINSSIAWHLSRNKDKAHHWIRQQILSGNPDDN